MRKIATLVVASAAALSLAACGSSDKASEDAQAENVEMPAEEAMGTVDASAVPSADAAAAPGAEAAAPPTDAAAPAAATPATGDGAAAEKATMDAEKKM